MPWCYSSPWRRVESSLIINISKNSQVMENTDPLVTPLLKPLPQAAAVQFVQKLAVWIATTKYCWNWNWISCTYFLCYLNFLNGCYVLSWFPLITSSHSLAKSCSDAIILTFYFLLLAASRVWVGHLYCYIPKVMKCKSIHMSKTFALETSFQLNWSTSS